MALDAADPDVHVAATRFFVKHGVSGDAGGLSGDAAQTVAAEAPAIVGEAKDALEYARSPSLSSSSESNSSSASSAIVSHVPWPEHAFGHAARWQNEPS